MPEKTASAPAAEQPQEPMAVHDFRQIADFVEQYKTPVLLPLKDEPSALLLPAGITAHAVLPLVDPFRKQPVRRKGTAELTTLDDFIAHVQRFHAGDSAVFAADSRSAPALTAVYDYHPSGPDNAAARFGEHRAIYRFPLSQEWVAWHAKNNQPMEQGEFYEFLETRILDVAPKPDLANMPAPDEATRRFLDMARILGADFAGAAEIMELARGLQIRVEDVLKDQPNVVSGETTLMYDSKHKDAEGRPLKVPGLFLVAIPVFNFGAVYRVAVRLRYRVSQGRVKWLYQLHRADWAFDDAFNEACARVAKDTGCPLFRGAPER